MTINPAVLSALAALLGSLVGASAPVLTTWIVQRNQYLTQYRLGDRARRETLYAEFISEASARFAEAVVTDTVDIAHIVPLHALVNRVRLYADEATVQAAEAVMTRLIADYYAPPMSLERVREATTLADRDPLLDFSRQARIELLGLR